MELYKKFLVIYPRYTVVTVLILFGLAMANYGGGTIINPEEVGHDFLRNFLSDLGKFNSGNMVSMVLFSSALVLVGILFSGHFYYFMKLYPIDRPIGWIVRIGCTIGIFGSICFAGVGLTPHNVLSQPHMFFVNWAFRSFLVTAILISITIFMDKRFLFRYGIGYVLFAVMIFFYILVLEYGPDPKGNDFALVFSVVAQKIIIFVFMLSVCFQSFGNSKLIADISSE